MYNEFIYSLYIYSVVCTVYIVVCIMFTIVFIASIQVKEVFNTLS